MMNKTTKQARMDAGKIGIRSN